MARRFGFEQDTKRWDTHQYSPTPLSDYFGTYQVSAELKNQENIKGPNGESAGVKSYGTWSTGEGAMEKIIAYSRYEGEEHPYLKNTIVFHEEGSGTTKKPTSCPYVIGHHRARPLLASM